MNAIKSALAAIIAISLTPIATQARNDAELPMQVGSFASSSYREAYALTGNGIEQQVSSLAPKFFDGASYQSYVSSLQDSGNYSAIKTNNFNTKVATGMEEAREMADDVWEVQFPAKITYSGKGEIEQCLSVTMKVKYQEFDPKVINMVSERVECVPQDFAALMKRLAAG